MPTRADCRISTGLAAGHEEAWRRPSYPLAPLRRPRVATCSHVRVMRSVLVAIHPKRTRGDWKGSIGAFRFEAGAGTDRAVSCWKRPYPSPPDPADAVVIGDPAASHPTTTVAHLLRTVRPATGGPSTLGRQRRRSPTLGADKPHLKGALSHSPQQSASCSGDAPGRRIASRIALVARLACLPSGASLASPGPQWPPPVAPHSVASRLKAEPSFYPVASLQPSRLDPPPLGAGAKAQGEG